MDHYEGIIDTHSHVLVLVLNHLLIELWVDVLVIHEGKLWEQHCFTGNNNIFNYTPVT